MGHSGVMVHESNEFPERSTAGVAARGWQWTVVSFSAPRSASFFWILGVPTILVVHVSQLFSVHIFDIFLFPLSLDGMDYRSFLPFTHISILLYFIS